MKTAAITRLRRKLAADQPVYGLWVTLESASISEMAAALDLDWIVIDAEHGHLDWKEIMEHLRATVRSETVALVRIAELNAGSIKRALDLGADGIVIPWIETAEQLDQAVRFSLYPPEGSRGIGAERATAWGQCFAQHAREANEHVLVVPLIETVTAGRNIEQLARCVGTELFFFGPADYSSTAGYRGEWEGPGVAQQLRGIKDVLRRHGKNCGVMTTGTEDLLARRGDGFRMLGLGADAGLLLRGLHAGLAAVGQDRRILPSLASEPIAPPAMPSRPSPALRPDRAEVITSRTSGPQIEIGPGVSLDCMVGAFNGARNLTTGIATFAPGATLAYHRHASAESITLLAGKAAVEVEGRRYEVEPLDNITVPRGLAHLVTNRSATEPAIFHVALASDRPDRDWVDQAYPRQLMTAETRTFPGGERATYRQTAHIYSPGSSAEFVDYFNAELIPGLEMSGGYGRFLPTGRLPAHLHDFDESICIVAGSATCVVEGRRHSLGDLATALQPRGRIHYFINETSQPMAMIWVYAGPLPERIIVAEDLANNPGAAWGA